jgi:hypothetical protein
MIPSKSGERDMSTTNPVVEIEPEAIFRWQDESRLILFYSKEDEIIIPGKKSKHANKRIRKLKALYKDDDVCEAIFTLTKAELKIYWDDYINKHLVQTKCPVSDTYHIWHLCFCSKCQEYGGRIYDHSQGSWNDHLRTVFADDLFTFTTKESE